MTDSIPSDEALRQSEERFRGAFQYSPIGIGIVGLDGRFLRVNPALCSIGGYSEAELLARSFQDVVPEEELGLHRAEVRRLLQGEIESYEREVRYRHKLGHFVWVRFTVSAIRDRDGQIVHLLGQAEDISVRREAEERLRQAERLEAVGRLAGGIAHEFNNLLAVIGGFARHALTSADSEPLRRDLTEIIGATDRAAEISRQLLTFSRHEEPRPTILDVNRVVGGVEPMLRRLLREDVELLVSLAPAACPVHADRSQLEQVIVNLVLNARDAVGEGGSIQIRTRPAEVNEGAALAQRLDPGSYISLAVADTGPGIEPEARKRLFDPFFTTKEQGQGTGLGLSIVYGIVERLGGAIVVESEPGHGATFTVYVPALDADALLGVRSEAVAAEAGQAAPGGTETIVVVEDEEALRSLIELILSEAGYHVLTAADGEAALALIRGTESQIDLVLTDAIMPRLGGAELVERLHAIRPTTRVIQMTGYSSDLASGSAGGLIEPIPKPFEPDTLLRTIRDALDRPEPGEGRRAGKAPADKT